MTSIDDTNPQAPRRLPETWRTFFVNRLPDNYYNEFDPYAAQWLRNLIAAGHIAPGSVDERSIVDVAPDDLAGFTQCHFFAGIGGWSLAARLAGWPDDRRLWTGSCPCQPFSVAGKGEGQKDERHLWPIFFDLISACRPDVVMGEQVAAAVGKDWLDGVHSDLEGIGYACGAAVVPACAVDAPHRRDRLWFVADAEVAGAGVESGEPLRQRWHTSDNQPESVRPGNRRASHLGVVAGSDSDVIVADTDRQRGQVDPHAGRSENGSGAREVAGLGGARHGALADPDQSRPQGRQVHAERGDQRSAWSNSVGMRGADGKARRVEPGIRLLAHGVPARVGKLRAYGNAIVPQVAAEVIAAYMECRP